MARSKDAIERRAQKRNKSIDEQRQADAKEMKRQLKKEEEVARKRRKIAANKHDEVIKARDAVLTATGAHSPQVSPMLTPKAVTLPHSQNKSVGEQRQADAKEMKKEEEVARKQRKNADKHNEVIQAKDAVSTATGAHPLKVSPIPILQNVAVPQSENETADKTNTKVSATSGEARNPLGEPGAWHCQGCGNHNFPSRNSCHSKTCEEKRPAGIFVPPRYKRPANGKHDESTNIKTKWPKQADQATVEQNVALRKKFIETGGEGMEEEDVNRAKILIARDERKKDKKKLRGRAKVPAKNQVRTRGD